jgi:sulfonate transport system permease protein
MVPVGVLVVWQAACSLGLVRSFLLPSPIEIAHRLWLMLLAGTLGANVLASALRVVQGFCLAAALGLSLGIAMGLFPRVSRTMDLSIQFIKAIPPIAWIPIAILWLGIGERAKIFIIAIGAFFPILLSTLDAVRQTDSRYVELARVLEVPRFRFIRSIILPGALPQIMTGLRLGATLAWMCVVAAELIAATRGIGVLIMDGVSLSHADVVIGGMILLGILGKVTDDGFRALERRLVRWRSAFTGL